MKKLAVFLVSAILSIPTIFAGGSAVPSMTEAMSSTYSSSHVSFPTGVFFNGSDFVKVESTWVRICIDGQSREYDIQNAEKDPYGNYALVLEGGISITIYSGGRSLYYDGATYSKR